MKTIHIQVKDKSFDIPIAWLAGGAAVLLAVVVIAAVSLSAHKNADLPEETAEATIEIENYDASAGVIDKKEYDGTILDETEDAGIDYIDSTLFLGDSNTARFLKEINPKTKKTYVSKENSIGVVGMGIDAISSFPCMDFSTGRMTMPQSVKILQPERVIITMGTNNLYGTSTETDSFIERYSAGIKAIEKAYPSVDIIVNSIPPVTKTTTYRNVTMTQIDAYNKAIAKMCQDNNWKYLNSAEILKDEKTGYAKDEYMSSHDGLHFSNKGIEVLFDYIRKHSWITEDDRPKPLAVIPNIIGVPDGLIKTDPLTNDKFTPEPAATEEIVIQTPTPTPTSTPTATPTPSATPTTSPGKKACEGYYGTWNGQTCACPGQKVWNSSTYQCVCPAGKQLDPKTGNCVVPQTQESVNPNPQPAVDPPSQGENNPEPPAEEKPEPEPEPDPPSVIEPEPEPEPEPPSEPEPQEPVVPDPPPEEESQSETQSVEP